MIAPVIPLVELRGDENEPVPYGIELVTAGRKDLTANLSPTLSARTSEFLLYDMAGAG